MTGSTSPVTPSSTPRSAAAHGRVNHWVVPLTLAMAALYLLAAWAMDVVPRMAPLLQQQSRALVTFNGSISYPMALDEVTGLGLRLFINNCVEEGILVGDMHLSDGGYLKIPEEIFSSEHNLAVAATSIAPADWITHLALLPDVTQIDTHPIWHCPAYSGSLIGRVVMAPPAPRPAVLQFAPSVAYDDALRVAAERGLRLADPCYEAAVAEGKHPAWHSESQQGTFARTATLVVAPTILTPNDWLLHLPLGVTPGSVIATCA